MTNIDLTSRNKPYTGKWEWLNRLGLRQGYESTVTNKDAHGNWFARMDTGAHEGFHQLVAKHLPTIVDLGELKWGYIPIGAPIKHLEETAAYAIGRIASLRLHLVLDQAYLEAGIARRI